MKPHRLLVALSALALVAAACGGGDESADTTEASTTTTSSTSTTTTVKATTTTSSTTTTVPAPTIRQPLTGAPLESEDQILQRPAMVVKIDNNAAAVPNHSGLGVADIVFEEIVEGRTTRFAAVFHSQDSDVIGPIRSGRTQDINMFMSFNEPLFVWSGGNGAVTAMIDASPLINMGPNHATGYYRGPGRAPHNYYNSTQSIWSQTPEGHPGPPFQQYHYLEAGEDFPGVATPGVNVKVGGENIAWTWNPDTAKFDRSQRGRDHNDKLTGRIGATNVIVMGVEYRPSPADRRSPEAQTLGEGPAWVFTGGEVVAGTWKRDSPIFGLEFYDESGTLIEMQPGNTWIELADVDDVNGGGVNILAASAA